MNTENRGDLQALLPDGTAALAVELVESLLGRRIIGLPV
jgi:hypothetical protein